MAHRLFAASLLLFSSAFPSKNKQTKTTRGFHNKTAADVTQRCIKSEPLAATLAGMPWRKHCPVCRDGHFCVLLRAIERTKQTHRHTRGTTRGGDLPRERRRLRNGLGAAGATRWRWRAEERGGKGAQPGLFLKPPSMSSARSARTQHHSMHGLRWRAGGKKNPKPPQSTAANNEYLRSGAVIKGMDCQRWNTWLVKEEVQVFIHCGAVSFPLHRVSTGGPLVVFRLSNASP